MTLIEELISMDGEDRLAVSAEEGKILMGLAANKKNIFELGTGNGYSTAWMSLAIGKDAQITTIDLERRQVFPVKEKNVRYFITSLQDYLKEHGEERFDFIFLDGDHTIDAIAKDVRTLANYLVDGGEVAVHDTVYAGNMGACLKDFFEGKDSARLREVGVEPSGYKWNYKHYDTQYGLGVAKRI